MFIPQLITPHSLPELSLLAETLEFKKWEQSFLKVVKMARMLFKFK